MLVLGTAPAVATLFRDPSGKGKFIETAIWQSWVWFTKMKLDDPYGYVGGLKVASDGCRVKPTSAAKIPHHQAHPNPNPSPHPHPNPHPSPNRTPRAASASRSTTRPGSGCAARARTCPPRRRRTSPN